MSHGDAMLRWAVVVLLRVGACVVMIGRVLVLLKAGSYGKPSPLHMRSGAVPCTRLRKHVQTPRMVQSCTD